MGQREDGVEDGEDEEDDLEDVDLDCRCGR